MHPSPLVDPATLKRLRRRLVWGVLQLEQPPQDLGLALQLFIHRWQHSAPPPPLNPGQRAALEHWRRQPFAEIAGLDPVLDVLMSSLRCSNGELLENLRFNALVRQVVTGPDDPEVRQELAALWTLISQGVQRLRQGLGPFSGEAETVLRQILAALQQLSDYRRNPHSAHLEEADRRWQQGQEQWERVAQLCLSGLQPAHSSIHWGRLEEQLPEGEASVQLRRQLRDWFQDWSVDLVYTVAPYLGQIVGMAPALEHFGLALLRWQKLLPDWPQEVAASWARFIEQSPPATNLAKEPPAYFRWLEPEYAIEEDFVKRNLWREWLQLARRHPPGSQTSGPSHRLTEGLRLARLECALLEPTYLRQQVEFPEAAWVLEVGEFFSAWQEGYDPLSSGAWQLLSDRVTQLEQLILREFLDPDRTQGAQTA